MALFNFFFVFVFHLNFHVGTEMGGGDLIFFFFLIQLIQDSSTHKDEMTIQVIIYVYGI